MHVVYFYFINIAVEQTLLLYWSLHTLCTLTCSSCFCTPPLTNEIILYIKKLLLIL